MKTESIGQKKANKQLQQMRRRIHQIALVLLPEENSSYTQRDPFNFGVYSTTGEQSLETSNNNT